MKLPAKFNKLIKPILSAVLCGGLAFCLFSSAAAQASDTLSLSQPDTSTYPNITFNFWPISADGTFVADLTAADVHVMENDREVKVTSLELVEPGMHIVFTVNEGKTLSNSYAGKPRFDTIKAALAKWIESESITTLDDFSLVNNTDILQNQLAHPSEWAQALTEYTPDLRAATPSLNSLSQSISLIKSLPSTDNKARAILYITPLPNAADFTTLQDLGTQAVSLHTRLYIWLIGPAEQYKTEAGATLLQKIAEDSGGSFFIFSGAEDLPNLNTYLNPLSHEYQLTYKTSLKKDSTNTLQLSAEKDNFKVTSETVSFDLKAAAPNPIFLSPPESITLNWVQGSDKKTWKLTPDAYSLKFMVEFPDGHQRDLTSARLLVDGQKAAEITQAPFTSLDWDLSAVTESGSHMLQIVIEDSAGFTSKTIETPVKVIVTPKPQTPLQKFISGINFITVGIIAFIVLLAVVMFFVFSRGLLKHPRLIKRRTKGDKDPVTQPVEIAQVENPAVPTIESPSDWPKLPGGGKAPARLLAVSTTTNKKSIPLPLQDTFFGNDSLKSDVVLSDPTIAPVHSKIFTDSARHFYIADCGTSAGTWVNYAPVTQQGTQLQHGDLVNIGAATFRFEEINPEGRPIQVIPLD
jgi:pSer/pThr/pTyr-binding forkhead associated (FHA) protein